MRIIMSSTGFPWLCSPKKPSKAFQEGSDWCWYPVLWHKLVELSLISSRGIRYVWDHLARNHTIAYNQHQLKQVSQGSMTVYCFNPSYHPLIPIQTWPFAKQKGEINFTRSRMYQKINTATHHNWIFAVQPIKAYYRTSHLEHAKLWQMDFNKIDPI